jgi:hypothetical protein
VGAVDTDEGCVVSEGSSGGVVEEESCVGVVEDEGGASVVTITIISASHCLPV